MRAGTVPADRALSALAKLAVLPERMVLETVLSAFAVVERDLLDEAIIPLYRKHVAELVGPIYRQLGLFPPAKGESVDQALKRALVVRTLALNAREPALIGQLTKYGRAELGLAPVPKGGALATDLRDEALTAALRGDPRGTLEPAIARLLASEDAQERSRLLTAIISLDDPSYSARVLSLALEPRLKTNERMAPLFGQAGQVPTRAHAVAWLQQNYDAFLAVLSANARPHVFAVLAQLNDEAAIEAARAFFEPRAQAMPGAAREFALAMESAELARAFHAQQSGLARGYFQGY
jgi:hypothetical protein